MPLGIDSLTFIDDAINSLMTGLDDLFSNKEERQKARNELQKLRNQLKTETQNHVQKMAEIAAEDRQQARSVQQKSLEKAWWAMPLLMILSFLGFFAILGAFVFVEVPPAANTPLSIMLGILGTIVTQIAQFLWGSSQGSKNKEDHMGRLMDQLAQNKGQSPETTQQSQSNQSTSTQPSIDASSTELQEVPQAKPEKIGW